MSALVLVKDTGSDLKYVREVAQTLLVQGFAEMRVDPSILAENLAPIRDGMRGITNDAELQELFAGNVVRTDEAGWKVEAGLFRRNNEDTPGNKENKWFFHYTPGMSLPGAQEARAFDPFISALARVNDAAKKIVLDLAKEIDALHADAGIQTESLYAAIMRVHAVTRALCYLEQEGESADAYPHFDRGAISVQWWASRQALVIIDKYGKHHRVDELALDRVAIFLGKKFAAKYSALNQKDISLYGYGTLHGVRDVRRQKALRDGDRNSLVTFVHAALTAEEVAWIRANKDAMDAFENAHKL